MLAIVAASAAVPALAKTTGLGLGVGVSASATVNARANLIANAQGRADQEITRRLDALNTLEARINAMTRLSSSTQSSLAATIQAQITALTTLKAKIAADASANSTSSLKTDIQSITKSYRIFALIMPQIAIDAAADRIEAVGGTMTTLAGKLQTRITDAQTAGTNVSSSVSALADMNAKIADANVQAQAAINEVSALKPDNGDQATMHANTAALQDARSKIVVAQHDLNTARQDAQTIIVALVQLNGGANASTSAH